MRLGIASIMQETNTFSVRPCRLEDFRVAHGPDLLDVVNGTNSELAGAFQVLTDAGAEVVPLVYAWAMPSGRVEQPAFEALRHYLLDSLDDSGPLDGLVLSLHGSMATDELDDADGELLSAARSAVGTSTPIAVSLDLHANVTQRMVALADSITAYHTDPHVDMADAGARAAQRAVAMVTGGPRPAIGYAKRPMIVPAETMDTQTGILAQIRRDALARAPRGLLDLLLFPVQPWLDVAELGFGVVAMVDGEAAAAAEFAETVAGEVWARRNDFIIDRLLEPAAAIAAARESPIRPFVMSESADAPTAGATGDSPAMVAALQNHGAGLIAYVPVVDPEAVARCHSEGVGQRLRLDVGASVDRRWRDPVAVEGVVTHLGEGTYRLQGASFTGMVVSMGRFATVESGSIRLLLSERPAWTADPATFRVAGLPPEKADVIIVRSCSDFRSNFPESAAEAITIDVPGAATPRLTNLQFNAAPRPPFPLDSHSELDR